MNFYGTVEGSNSVYWLEPYTGGYPGCYGDFQTRLLGYSQGYVVQGPANNLRVAPGISSARVGQIPAGGAFSILEGPQCNDGYIWYRVNYNGLVGWTAESRGGNTFYLAPLG